MRKIILGGMTAAVGVSMALAMTATAAPSGGDVSTLKLHPNGFGTNSYAAWKAQQGEADDQGSANQALYFQKMTSTVTNAAGIAVVDGIAGTPADQLTGLEWQHRDDGHCGAGAPRWNVVVTNPTDPTHSQRTVFLGCATAAHSPGDESNWTKDTYSGDALSNQFMSGDVIQSLAIVFDEGNDVGQGFVYLDNIKVTEGQNSKTWTSAADNGNG